MEIQKVNDKYVVMFNREDIIAIKNSNYLYGLCYSEEDEEWTTTSVLLDNDNAHFHGYGRTILEAILMMEKQVDNFLVELKKSQK